MCESITHSKVIFSNLSFCKFFEIKFSKIKEFSGAFEGIFDGREFSRVVDLDPDSFFLLQHSTE
jgi:hypothetical protein